MAGDVISYTRIQFLDLFPKDYVLPVQFGISLFKECKLALQHTAYLLQLYLPSLIIIDNFIFEYGNPVFNISGDVRIEEFEWLGKQYIAALKLFLILFSHGQVLHGGTTFVAVLIIHVAW